MLQERQLAQLGLIFPGVLVEQTLQRIVDVAHGALLVGHGRLGVEVIGARNDVAEGVAQRGAARSTTQTFDAAPAESAPNPSRDRRASA